jgi:DNA polymerase-3 subunit gamma/tau
MRAQLEAKQAEIELGVQSDPLVQAVLSRFPGAKIVGVTQNAPEASEAAPDTIPGDEVED